MTEQFLDFMMTQNWSIKRGRNCPVPKAIKQRYPCIPDSWLQFIEEIKELASGDEKVWFLCAEDYDIRLEHTWNWNEWEQLSLQSAEGDDSLADEITAFWNSHFPIIMSVRDGYAYYAISMPDGGVVYGVEPEFEACKTVSASFEDFLHKVMEGTIVL